MLSLSLSLSHTHTHVRTYVYWQAKKRTSKQIYKQALHMDVDRLIDAYEKVQIQIHVFVSLFNGTSKFVGYLMANPSCTKSVMLLFNP